MTKVFTANQALEIYKQFRAKTADPRAKLRVALEITKEIQIDIMVYSKTAEQRLPTMKKFSTSVPFSKYKTYLSNKITYFIRVNFLYLLIFNFFALIIFTVKILSILYNLN
jgi:hypothetical protein